MDVNLNKEKLGEMLVEGGLISEDQLKMALEFQQKVGGRLGEILVKFDYVSEDALIDLVAKQQNLDTVDLDEMVLPEELIQEIPKELIEKHEVIPVEIDGDTLKLAIHDPFAINSLEEIQLATDYRIDVALATRDSIKKTINKLFYHEEKDQVSSLEKEPLLLKKVREKLNNNEASAGEILESVIILLEEKGVLDWSEIDSKIEQR